MDRPPPNQQPPYYVPPLCRHQHPQRPPGNPFPNNNSRLQASSYPVQSTSAWSSAHQPEDHLPNASSELSSNYSARPVAPPSVVAAAVAPSTHAYGSSGGSGSSTTMSRGMVGRNISNATGITRTRAGSNGRDRGTSGEERSRSTTAPSMDRRSSAPSRTLSFTADPRKVYIGMIRVGTPPGIIRNLFAKFGLESMTYGPSPPLLGPNPTPNEVENSKFVYAHIQFKTTEGARNALSLNGAQISDTCRIAVKAARPEVITPRVRASGSMSEQGASGSGMRNGVTAIPYEARSFGNTGIHSTRFGPAVPSGSSTSGRTYRSPIGSGGNSPFRSTTYDGAHSNNPRLSQGPTISSYPHFPVPPNSNLPTSRTASVNPYGAPSTLASTVHPPYLPIKTSPASTLPAIRGQATAHNASGIARNNSASLPTSKLSSLAPNTLPVPSRLYDPSSSSSTAFIVNATPQPSASTSTLFRPPPSPTPKIEASQERISTGIMRVGSLTNEPSVVSKSREVRGPQQRFKRFRPPSLNISHMGQLLKSAGALYNYSKVKDQAIPKILSRTYMYAIPELESTQKEFCKVIKATLRLVLPVDIESMTVRCKEAKDLNRLIITICDAKYPLALEDDDNLPEPARDQDAEEIRSTGANNEAEDMDISDVEGSIMPPRANARHPVGLGAASDVSVEKEEGRLQERVGPQDTEENHEGELEEKVELAENLRGSTIAAVKLRQRFLVSVLKRAFEEGKVVISNRFESEYLVLRYVLDESQSDNESAAAVLPVPSTSIPNSTRDLAVTAVVEPSSVSIAGLNLPSIVSTPLTDVEMEDIKPQYREPSQSRDSEEEEVDQLAIPEPDIPVVPFPLQGRGSSWDCQETKVQAKKFIAAFFPLHDGSRGLLSDFYMSTALFSVRCVEAKPRALLGPPTAFKKGYKYSGVAITPVPICHAIRGLPPGSHNLSKITFDAYALPSVKLSRGKGGKATILLIVHGEFEEFPAHLTRSFDRIFVLAPKDSSTGGAGCPLDYLIASDQLTFRHFDKDARMPLVLRESTPTSPLIPAPTSRPIIAPSVLPSPLPSIAPPQATSHPVAPQAPPRKIAPAVQSVVPQPPSRNLEIHSRIPTASPEVLRTVQPATKRTRPERSPSTDFSSDVEIIDDQTPPAKRVAREVSTPSPSPPPQTLRKASDKSLGKRRAVSPLPSSPVVDRSPSVELSVPLARGVGVAQARRLERLAHVGGELDADDTTSIDSLKRGSVLSEKDVEKIVERLLKKSRKGDVAAAAVGGPVIQLPVPRQRAPAAPLSESEDDDMIVAPPKKKKSTVISLRGGSISALHGCNGYNKVRMLFDASTTSREAFLSVTHTGDVLEWDGEDRLASVRKVYQGAESEKGFRVDDAAYSTQQETLIVGYLGPTKPSGQEQQCPDHQVRIFERGDSSRANVKEYIPTALGTFPHRNGGVTSITLVPDSRHLKFATGGQDRMIYLWSRDSQSGVVKTNVITNQHSGRPITLCVNESRNYLVSGGDKRVLAYDLRTRQQVMSIILPALVTLVQDIPSCPNLILTRTATPSNQFGIYDLRAPTKNQSPVLQFGFTVPVATKIVASADKNLGRFYRGSFRGKTYAHPDTEQGVKLWDLRKLEKSSPLAKESAMAGAGRSKVHQTLFRGEDTLVLSELQNFTRLKI